MSTMSTLIHLARTYLLFLCRGCVPVESRSYGRPEDVTRLLRCFRKGDSVRAWSLWILNYRSLIVLYILHMFLRFCKRSTFLEVRIADIAALMQALGQRLRWRQRRDI